MKLLKYLFSISIVFSSSFYFAQSTEIEDIKFDNIVNINGKSTVLNGGGLREKYGFMDLYVGGLYFALRGNAKYGF